MSPEFSPRAPKETATESRPDAKIELKGAYLRYEEIAKSVYKKAISTAENIDDKIQTSIPFNKNAVSAALLLSLAAVRGAQIT